MTNSKSCYQPLPFECKINWQYYLTVLRLPRVTYFANSCTLRSRTTFCVYSLLPGHNMCAQFIDEHIADTSASGVGITALASSSRESTALSSNFPGQHVLYLFKHCYWLLLGQQEMVQWLRDRREPNPHAYCCSRENFLENM